MPELPKLGFLIDVDNRRRLVVRERLLDAWTEAYARRLRPKSPIARYQAADLKWTEKLVAPINARAGLVPPCCVEGLGQPDGPGMLTMFE